ncbi:MAG: TetR/AcrR family transcriptional regulator [Pseudomonadota bacterium]
MSSGNPEPTTALSPKQAEILQCALVLLRETGDAGLTMRKLAERANMRLSNVQYYFPSKANVLNAMVTVYFQECTQSVAELTANTGGATLRERMGYLIELGLSHGASISDMCKIFREIWAISSRNPAVHACLMDYYRDFADTVIAYLDVPDVNEKQIDALVSLLVPYFEGYSVTAPALALPASDVQGMLTHLAMKIVSPDAP